eukprot:TRINITY_DN19756_c0_g1_i1.p2 TRINITY_DN19756_c0_g1~~TRINITY_DN19756_c0_g1_i1.p2  ORF type:complete len:132 (-),score=4.10 TRINITY_DN19756_c0_g1_i1:6-401(-)
MVHYAITTSQCQEVGAVSNQTTCRDQELQTNLTATIVDHVNHLCFTCAQALHDGTHAFFRDINQQALKRFHFLTVNFFDDNFWFGYLKLITFTTHIFNQDTQVKLTTSGNDKCIWALCFFNTKGYVSFQFF